MIKKLFLLLFLVTLIVSCGKKGNPVYKKTTSTFLNTESKLVL